jgi:hypothetical protein
MTALYSHSRQRDSRHPSYVYHVTAALPVLRHPHAPCLATTLWALSSLAPQHARHRTLRQEHPGSLSAAEAIAFTGKSSRTFYKWLKRYGITPLAKTAHLTLYSRQALWWALTNPPPVDELAPRRAAKQAAQATKRP